MDSYLYDTNKREWFSPFYIIKMYQILIKKHGSDLYKSKYRKVRESFATAILLLGLHEKQNIQYFMQVPDEDPPDLITMRQTERKGLPILGEFVEVEVVEYNDFTETDSIVEFLKKTKLSKKKSYDEKTVILCYINRNNFLKYSEIHDELKKLNPLPEIYIVGVVSQTKDICAIVKIWPEIEGPVKISLVSKLINYPRPHVIKLHKSMKDKIEFKTISSKTPTPEEVFRLSV